MRGPLHPQPDAQPRSCPPFSIIEDYISTTYANKMTKGPAPKNGMKAAVVGAGLPA